MTTLTAASMMARSEATLAPDTDIYDAIKELLKRKLTGAPVVDADGVLIGMLTERDCLKVMAGWAMESLPQGKVRDYMSTPAESVAPDMSIYDLVQVFLQKPFRKLPVVDAAGKVIGQISRRDTLVGMESVRANPRSYGFDGDVPSEGFGVHSAMKAARGQK